MIMMDSKNIIFILLLLVVIYFVQRTVTLGTVFVEPLIPVLERLLFFLLLQFLLQVFLGHEEDVMLASGSDVFVAEV